MHVMNAYNLLFRLQRKYIELNVLLTNCKIEEVQIQTDIFNMHSVHEL